MTITIEKGRTDGTLAVKFPRYDPVFIEIIHGTPNQGFSRADSKWVIPDEAIGIFMARASDHKVDLDAHARGVLSGASSGQRGNRRRVAPGVPIQCPGDLALMPFQETAVHKTDKFGGRILIGDEVGLGKSIEALGYIRKHPEIRPVLIICPATMKLTWERECLKWLSDLDEKIVVLGGTTEADMGDATVAIANYDILFKRWKKPEPDELKQMAVGACTKGFEGCKMDSHDPKLHIRGCPAKKVLREAVKRPQGWGKKLTGWAKLLVVDEIQACKSRKSQRAKEVKKIARKSISVLGLTGTPILNRPAELWNIADIINPAVFGDQWGFMQRYCDPKQQTISVKGPKKGQNPQRGTFKATNKWGKEQSYRNIQTFDGASNLDEMERTLRKHLMIRRLKREVLPDLPKVQKATLWSEAKLTKEYKELAKKLRSKALEYKEAGRVLRKALEGKSEDEQKHVLAAEAAKVARFKLRGMMLAEITALRQEIARMKLPHVIDWSTEFLTDNPGQKLIIFAWHIAIQEELLGAMRPFGAVAISGGMSLKKRQESIDKFQTDDATRVIVLSELAASQGITLTAASNMLLAELPWNPALVDQCLGRFDRIGQKANSLTGWFMIAADTLEEKIAKMIDVKRTVVAASLGDVSEMVEKKAILESLIEELAA